MATENDRKLYDSAYKECVAAIRNSIDAYDKNLITISSAFLALPVALFHQPSIRTLVGSADLYLAMGGFVATILCVIVSFSVSTKVQRCRLKDIDDYYLQGKEEAFNRNSYWSTFLTVLNVLSGAFFFAAALLIAIFTYRNLGSF